MNDNSCLLNWDTIVEDSNQTTFFFQVRLQRHNYSCMYIYNIYAIYIYICGVEFAGERKDKILSI